jgi:proteic killer suppression protein
MDIVSIVHRGLRDYYLNGNARGLNRQLVPRIRTILFALRAAPDMAAVEGPPGWRIHRLRGDRAGDWSISVSGNWRLTFRIEDGAIVNLNLEDYH